MILTEETKVYNNEEEFLVTCMRYFIGRSVGRSVGRPIGRSVGRSVVRSVCPAFTLLAFLSSFHITAPAQSHGIDLDVYTAPPAAPASLHTTAPAQNIVS